MERKEVDLIVTEPYIRALARLVEEGIYLNRQASIRDALRRLFRFYKIEPFGEKVAKTEKVDG